jgi:hypothetical protein
MSPSTFRALPGVADVHHVVGLGAPPDLPPSVLIEVPHGACRRAHFETLRARLRGPLPEDLEAYFHVNTDVGAFEAGLAIAQGLLARSRARSVLVIRCLLPRTFVDTNRIVSAPGGDGLRAGGMTSSIPDYVENPDDRALLTELHEQYAGLVDAAAATIMGAGGIGLMPHSYAPRTVGIDRIGPDIGARLREVWAQPERWPLRPEVDLITRTPDGRDLSLPGLALALREAWADRGVLAEEGGTYTLHPATRAAALAELWPGRVLCFELRRDLLVRRWTPFMEMEADPEKVAELVAPIVDGVDGILTSEGR